MTLEAQPAYPNSRAYVLKLHRDAFPGSGSFSGRIENVVTGQSFVFNSAEELMACLARDIAPTPL